MYTTIQCSRCGSHNTDYDAHESLGDSSVYICGNCGRRTDVRPVFETPIPYGLLQAVERKLESIYATIKQCDTDAKSVMTSLHTQGAEYDEYYNDEHWVHITLIAEIAFKQLDSLLSKLERYTFKYDYSGIGPKDRGYAYNRAIDNVSALRVVYEQLYEALHVREDLVAGHAFRLTHTEVHIQASLMNMKRALEEAEFKSTSKRVVEEANNYTTPNYIKL